MKYEITWSMHPYLQIWKELEPNKMSKGKEMLN